jgi:hypothetical protein
MKSKRKKGGEIEKRVKCQDSIHVKHLQHTQTQGPWVNILITKKSSIRFKSSVVFTTF